MKSMAINPKYDFYEKVIVKFKDKTKLQINNEAGVVLGRSQNDTGIWSYAVHIYKESEVWQIPEEGLVSAGVYDKKREFLFR